MATTLTSVSLCRVRGHAASPEDERCAYGQRTEIPGEVGSHRCCSIREPHAAATNAAGRPFGDQGYASMRQSLDYLHERIHVAADISVARLHSLDGGKGHAGGFRELTLIPAQQRTGGFHLSGANHGVRKFIGDA